MSSGHRDIRPTRAYRTFYGWRVEIAYDAPKGGRERRVLRTMACVITTLLENFTFLMKNHHANIDAQIAPRHSKLADTLLLASLIESREVRSTLLSRSTQTQTDIHKHYSDTHAQTHRHTHTDK